MKTSWVQGLEKEQSIDVTQNFKESLVLRKRLSDLLQAKAETAWKKSKAEVGYENPNWAYLQADSRGYERAMQEIISLISD